MLDSANNVTSFDSPENSFSADHNALNQISSLNGSNYVYDRNGNVLDDGVRSYSWDAENRLLSAGFKAQPSRKTAFGYDGFGRRSVIESANGTTSQTRFLWCGDQLCQTRTSSDIVIKRYFAEGEMMPLSGSGLYYAEDQLGSVRDVLGTENGSRLASFDYTPFGYLKESVGRMSTDFRFAGMFYEGNSGVFLTRYEPIVQLSVVGYREIRPGNSATKAQTCMRMRMQIRRTSLIRSAWRAEVSVASTQSRNFRRDPRMGVQVDRRQMEARPTNLRRSQHQGPSVSRCLCSGSAEQVCRSARSASSAAMSSP